MLYDTAPTQRHSEPAALTQRDDGTTIMRCTHSVQRVKDVPSQVLAQVATGAGNKEIARALAISPNTVRNHLYAAYPKIGVQSRTAAALYAVREGLAQPRLAPADRERTLR